MNTSQIIIIMLTPNFQDKKNHGKQRGKLPEDVKFIIFVYSPLLQAQGRWTRSLPPMAPMQIRWWPSGRRRYNPRWAILLLLCHIILYRVLYMYMLYCMLDIIYHWCYISFYHLIYLHVWRISKHDFCLCQIVYSSYDIHFQTFPFFPVLTLFGPPNRERAIPYLSGIPNWPPQDIVAPSDVVAFLSFLS